MSPVPKCSCKGTASSSMAAAHTSRCCGVSQLQLSASRARQRKRSMKAASRSSGPQDKATIEGKRGASELSDTTVVPTLALRRLGDHTASPWLVGCRVGFGGSCWVGCPYCFRWETKEGSGAKVPRELDQVGPESTCATWPHGCLRTGPVQCLSHRKINETHQLDLAPPTACKNLTATVFAVAACGTSDVLWQLNWEPS